MKELINARELRESGLLQEINRQLLHPRGLRLVISYDPNKPGDQGTYCGVFRAVPDDLEGTLYPAFTSDHVEWAAKVGADWNKRLKVRQRALGFTIQPIGPVEKCTKWWHSFFHVLEEKEELTTTCLAPGSRPETEYSISKHSCPICKKRWVVDHIESCLEYERLRDEKLDKTERWWGREVFTREGITREFEFKTQGEAAAFVVGYNLAKETSENGTEHGQFDPLEDFVAVASNVSSENFPVN